MSQKAIVLGVAGRLKELPGLAGVPVTTSYEAFVSGVNAGSRHFLVTGGGLRSAAARPGSSDKRYSVSVALLEGFSPLARDRRGPALYSPEAATLLESAERVLDYLVADFRVLRLADGFLAKLEPDTNGFLEPFDTGSVKPVTDDGAKYLGAKPDPNGAGILVAVIDLAGARRLHLLDPTASAADADD